MTKTTDELNDTEINDVAGGVGISEHPGDTGEIIVRHKQGQDHIPPGPHVPTGPNERPRH